jgi:hypothetical protein
MFLGYPTLAQFKDPSLQSSYVQYVDFISAWTCGKNRKTLETSHIYVIIFLLALYHLRSVQIDYFSYTDYLILFPWSFDFMQRYGHAESAPAPRSNVKRSWVLFWHLIHHDDQNSKPDSKPDSKPSHVQ